MKKLMTILLLSCKKATELIEKKLYFGLSLREKAQLYMHSSMCDTCKSWQVQSHIIDQSLKHQINSRELVIDYTEKLSNEKKELIIKKVNN